MASYKRRFKTTSSRDNKERPSSLTEIQTNTAFNIFEGRPFWCDRQIPLDRCCFNHIIGLPEKDGKSFPIFDYEIELFKALETYKDIWIKKARGLGITELLLRYMVWLCVFNKSYQNTRFHIVTGPRINLAEELIDRIYNLFSSPTLLYLQRLIKRTGPIVVVNNVTIQAFPSHTVSTMRGYTDVKFILLDEGDYFPVGQQEEARAVSEGYRIKTRPWIVMVSTPYKPGGMFDTIERDGNSTYKKLFYHYTQGIGKIYNEDEIAKEKTQAYFKREYELSYGYGIGNVFNETVLTHVEELGKEYRERYRQAPKINTYSQKSLGIDPGFGSSKTTFCITEFIDGIIRVIYSREFNNASTEDMVRHAYRLVLQYQLNNGTNKIYIDGSNPGFIRSLKQAMGEFVNYDVFVEKAKADKRELFYYMNVVPVNFSTEGRAMLSNVKKWIDKQRVAIDPDEHKELMLDLRIAQSDEEMKLDKTDNTMDMLDALRLAFEYYEY
jgi:hypothetical protein